MNDTNQTIYKLDFIRIVLWTGKIPDLEPKQFKDKTRIPKIVFLAQQELEFKTLQSSNKIVYDDSPFLFDLENREVVSHEINSLISKLLQSGEIEITQNDIVFKDNFQSSLKDMIALADTNNTVKRWMWKIRYLGNFTSEELGKEVMHKLEANKFVDSFFKS